MAAGPTIAAQTAQAPGVAGASASSGAGLFGKSTSTNGAMAGFESLLTAFFGNQTATPTGAVAGVLTTAAAKAAASQTSGDGSAKTADDKASVADAAATGDTATASTTDAASTALLYILAGQAAPTAPQTASATAAKSADGAASADDILQGGGKPGAAPGSALAQAARIAQAATGDDTGVQADGAGASVDAAATAGDTPANLTLPGKLGSGPATASSRNAAAAGKDASTYAPASPAAPAGNPAPQAAVGNAAPQAPAAEVAPQAAVAAADAATPIAAEVAAEDLAPQPGLTAPERPLARAAKAADTRKGAATAASAPSANATAAPVAAPLAAAASAATVASGLAAGADAVEAVDPGAARDETKIEADAKDATAQPAAAAPLAADQATGTSKAAVPVRGSPETVATLAAQIIKKLDGRTTRFDLALTPADLGRVDVRIEIGAQGRLTASMSFENPQAAAELRGRAGELQNALEQAGFDMSGGMTFDWAGDPNQSQANQNQTGQSTSDNGGQARGRAFQAALDTASGSADAALTSALAYRARPVSGVDIRI